MSSPTGPISEEEIEGLRTAFYQIATGFVLWGLQIALALQALSILSHGAKRDTRAHRAPRWMSAIVLVMLASSTAIVFISLEFFLVKLPATGTPLTSSPEILQKMVDYEVGRTWLTRLNYILSDIIVVWRAWVLWPRHALIHWILGIVTGITILCTIVNAALSTVPSITEYNVMNPSGGSMALLYIPLIVTNTLATVLICYKAWMYRRELRTFASSTGTSTRSWRSTSSIQLDRVFALFIETGALYVVFFILKILSVYGVFMGTRAGAEFSDVWRVVMNGVSCTYPTIIIIFVSKYMSTHDAVIASDSSDLHATMPDSELESGFGRRGKHATGTMRTLSTIRFDSPSPTSTQGQTYESGFSEEGYAEKSDVKEQDVGRAV